ncbi:minichromosome maintenance protein 5 [Chytridiales sp. JEL 0842]|nr:minichromosome maintenance protein 5 [Chytridiales sp. JEL 0842]
MSGWDRGNIYSSSVLPGEFGDDNSTAAITAKFSKFIMDFRLDSAFIYRDQLRQNLVIKQFFLEVDMAHLTSFDEELSNQLKDKPSEYLPLFEDAVKGVARQNQLVQSQEEVPDCQVMLLSNANPIPLRELDASYVSKLVRIHGITISASILSAQATHVHIMCRNCRHTKVLPVNSGFAGIQLPRQCDGEPVDGAEPKDCPLDPYQIIPDKSRFVDVQTLKLQEAPDMVPVGELPRHILLSADRYLTSKVVPGVRVAVTGIYSIFQAKASKGARAIATRVPYIRIVGMQADVDGGRFRTFSPEEEDQFTAMSRRPNLYEEFSNSIAPSIYGSADVKKAITCLLFGGSKTILPDGMKLRGDVNVLLLGDPGVAKSQLLKFVERVAPTAVYTSGKGSSAAGLTASVVRDATSREFHLEAGAMVLADGGVVCIDEFDKMREEDRVAIHEAMEQQTISIAKAGITTILNSRTSVLAAANPVFGRYDDAKTAAENIDFQSTILSRFDLIFILKDEHNETLDKTIASHVLNVHMNTAVEASGEISMQRMRSYISYCKAKCAPRLSVEATEKLSSHFVEVRSKVRGMDKRSTIPITIRQLEAITRVSEAIAKITLSPTVNERHVDEAIRLFNFSTMNAVNAGDDGGISGNTPAFNEDVHKVISVIKKRLQVGSRISTRNLVDELIEVNYTERVIMRALDILIRKEILEYRDRRLKIVRLKA